MNDSGNIGMDFIEQARLHPEQPAVIVQGRAGHYETMTFRELLARSARLAEKLQAAGVGKGTRIAVMVPPGFDFYALAITLIGLGAIPIVIDPGMGLRKVKQALAKGRPEVFIGIWQAQFIGWVLGWGRSSIRTRLTLWRSRAHSLPEAQKDSTDAATTSLEPPFITARPEDPAALIFTSGSTGPAKGVVLTHGMLQAQSGVIRTVLGVGPTDRDLASYPLLALFAPGLGMASIVPRIDVTRADAVDAAAILNAIQIQHATTMFASPALIRRLGRYGRERGIRLPTLRRVIMAGAPADSRAIESFLLLIQPETRFDVLYGATEAMPICLMEARQILAETDRATARGAGVCLGAPLAHIRLKIIAIHDGAIPVWRDDLEVPDGTFGEIVVQGAVVAGEYFAEPELTRLARIDIPGGGFFHRMGDIGYLDAQGRVWFCGRKSQRVMIGEQVLYTIACERVFSAHPAVRRAALVGADRGVQIEPVICIELEAPQSVHDQELIKRELLTLGAAQEQTRALTTILFHPRFPVDRRHSSKVGREALARWAAKQPNW